MLLSHRFGAAGPGLVAWDGPGHDRLTQAHVADHARRYFVRLWRTAVDLAGRGPTEAELAHELGRVPSDLR